MSRNKHREKCKATLEHKCRTCDAKSCPAIEALLLEQDAWDQLSDEAWELTMERIQQNTQGLNNE